MVLQHLCWSAGEFPPVGCQKLTSFPDMLHCTLGTLRANRFSHGFIGSERCNAEPEALPHPSYEEAEYLHQAGLNWGFNRYSLKLKTPFLQFVNIRPIISAQGRQRTHGKGIMKSYLRRAITCMGQF